MAAVGNGETREQTSIPTIYEAGIHPPGRVLHIGSQPIKPAILRTSPGEVKDAEIPPEPFSSCYQLRNGSSILIDRPRLKAIKRTEVKALCHKWKVS
jgi:hypothetical protein